ncbi:hypothetical protein Tco_1420051, partial [Tanacetum coccineum]
MTPTKRTTRASPATTTTTTPVTNPQLKALIDQGVADALAARDADRSRNGDDNHNSGTGTEAVVGLTQWFERMETVFNINNCAVENQVKFATCTLRGVAMVEIPCQDNWLGYRSQHALEHTYENVGSLNTSLHTIDH